MNKTHPTYLIRNYILQRSFFSRLLGKAFFFSWISKETSSRWDVGYDATLKCESLPYPDYRKLLYTHTGTNAHIHTNIERKHSSRREWRLTQSRRHRHQLEALDVRTNTFTHTVYTHSHICKSFQVIPCLLVL